ncbi:MAG: phytoene desaturase [Calditrichaeota bacterium]|nr:MAG: phytoene desaturase [Calditrichota bacterium]MBL1207814.1 phytoene desaturase [Calditrichota bacterium]NOG47648.1 phytoene desaturase [Calditrichota bacterium]
MKTKKIVVIGAGFGGLASAIRLQARGHHVTILEKREKVGGKAYQLKKAGYTFDMGPSLITEPKIIEDVFKSAGKKMEDYLDLTLLDPYYRIFFHDNSYIDYSSDSEFMKEQMRKFNPKDAENYDSFMDLSKQLHKAVITDELGSEPFSKISTMLSFLPQAIKLNALSSAYGVVKKFFKDFRHQFLFSFHPLFIGGNPFKAPALYLMIPYMEKEGGVWYAKGGMYSVVEAFVKVFEELGGTIETNSAADSIQVENGRAVGVRSSKRVFPADMVVSNADFKHTYDDLIESKHRKKWSPQKLEKLDYSMSAFILYLGVKKKYSKLKHHTLVLSERYKGLIDDIFVNNVLPDDQSMYLHMPSITDPTMAPEGCESMYVLIPVSNMDAGIEWDEVKENYSKQILNFLEHDFKLEGLQDSIEVMEIFTPKDFAKTQNAYKGSAWGVEPTLLQSAYFRPHNQSEDIENMFLVGASTHPGAGVPGVLLTAEATEKAIINYLKETKIKTKSA